MDTNVNIHTRIATSDDQDFIISLLPRLIEFGPPSWRDKNGMIATDTQIITDKLNNKTPEQSYL